MITTVISVLIIITFGVVLVGAPYVPTRKRDVEAVFDRVDVRGGRLVDLGAGDGRLLLAAAERGYKSTGYELSPSLFVVCWLRLLKTPQATVKLANFWRARLPEDTTVVFTFLASKYMHKLDRLMFRESKRLNKRLTLVSYGFRLDNRQPDHRYGPLMVYEFQP